MRPTSDDEPPPQGPLLRATLDSAGVPLGVTLVITHRGVDAPEIIPVHAPIVVLGRAPPADIVVESALVSRRQLTLRFTAAGVEIEDLESTGGTYVNDRILRGPTALREGDTIQAAGLVIQVHCG